MADQWGTDEAERASAWAFDAGVARHSASMN